MQCIVTTKNTKLKTECIYFIECEIDVDDENEEVESDETEEVESDETEEVESEETEEVESEETLEVDNEEDSEETGEEHETDTINKGLIRLFQNILCMCYVYYHI